MKNEFIAKEEMLFGESKKFRNSLLFHPLSAALLDEIASEYPGRDVDDILKCWTEEHRVYHNLDHLEELLRRIEVYRSSFEGEPIDWKMVRYVALFHDIVYEVGPLVREGRNESESGRYIGRFFEGTDVLKKKDGTRDWWNRVATIINATADHFKEYKDPTTKFFCLLDLYPLSLDFTGMVKWEEQIRKEYGWAPIQKYVEERVKFLEKVAKWTTKQEESDVDNTPYDLLFPDVNTIYSLIKYIKHRTYRIGVYAGDFGPFHAGHLSILKQAQPLFDQIIVVDENHSKFGGLPLVINYLTIPIFSQFGDTLIALLEGTEKELKVKGINYNITLIRGVRNSAEFSKREDEKRFLGDLGWKGNTVFFSPSPETAHITSSAIRKLHKIDPEKAKPFLLYSLNLPDPHDSY